MLSIDFLRLNMYMSTLVQWKIRVLGIYIKLSIDTEVLKREKIMTLKREKNAQSITVWFVGVCLDWEADKVNEECNITSVVTAVLTDQ